jgi:hypothetical protein
MTSSQTSTTIIVHVTANGEYARIPWRDIPAWATSVSVDVNEVVWWTSFYTDDYAAVFLADKNKKPEWSIS